MLTKNIYSNGQELVGKLKHGDIKAFNLLFNAYSSRLYHFAYGYLKSKEDAEGLVQDIFTTIWERRSQLDPELNFKSYLFTIAFNSIKKHFRGKALLSRYIEHVERDEIHQDFNQIDYINLKNLVEELVNEMPEKRKEVFIKSRFEGKNAHEIAQEMSISKSTVENHLNQALKFLRHHLSQKYLAGLLFFSLFL